MRYTRFLALPLMALSALSLTACGTPEEPRLEGDRISILELQESLRADDVSSLPDMRLQKEWQNEFWPQAGGYPNHAMQHIALGQDVQPIWQQDIGDAGDDDLPLMTQPIVVNGMVITLDARSLVRAFDAESGALLWEQDDALRADDDRVITGGLAYGDQRIFVTSGYNEVLALDYKTGAVIWRSVLSGASQVPPSVLDGRVYVTTIDNSLSVLDVKDGSALWSYASVSEGTGVIGGASPAVNRDMVVAAFSSGEVAALRVDNGALLWSENLDTMSQYGGIGSIADIKALPVMDKGLLVALNYSGRMAALDMRTGRRVWQRDIGSTQTPWVSGDAIFVMSADSDLIALNRKTGLIYWVAELPAYLDPEDKDDPITWFAPILAGERLILTNSYGDVQEFDPKTGDVLHAWSIGARLISAPIVAGAKLFAISDRGRVLAFQ